MFLAKLTTTLGGAINAQPLSKKQANLTAGALKIQLNISPQPTLGPGLPRMTCPSTQLAPPAELCAPTPKKHTPTVYQLNSSRQNAKGPVRQTQPPPQCESTTASNHGRPQDPSNNTILERWINCQNVGNPPTPATLQPQMGPFSLRIEPILTDDSISPNNPNPSLF